MLYHGSDLKSESNVTPFDQEHSTGLSKRCPGSETSSFELGSVVWIKYDLSHSTGVSFLSMAILLACFVAESVFICSNFCKEGNATGSW